MDELNLHWKQVRFILLLVGVVLLVYGIYSVGYKIGIEKATKQCEVYKIIHCECKEEYPHQTIEKINIEIKEKIKI